MNPEINDLLGAETPEKQNPLEKINEASKEVSKKQPESKEKVSSFDDETFKQILMAGDNTEGLFVPNEDKKEEKENPKHAEVDEDAQIKQGKVGKPKGKYTKNFLKDITKNPEDYKVQTPKGEMTIAEAIRKGYNPITKTFEKEKSADAIKEKHLGGLNDADRAKLEELTNPAAARVASKDAEAMGLPANSPMIAGQPAPAQPPMPEGQAVPPVQGGAPTPEGGAGPDIANMLGGM